LGIPDIEIDIESIEVEPGLWERFTDSAGDLFEDEDDAAYAFGQVANPETNKDQKERGAVIREVVYYEYTQTGEMVGKRGYTYGKIYTGQHNRVFNAAFAALVTPGKVSFVHTHPNCSCGLSPDKFSTGLISDEGLARLGKINNVYLTTLNTGELLKFDESRTVPPYENTIEYDLPKFNKDQTCNFK